MLRRVALAGDRGLLTSARIRREVEPAFRSFKTAGLKVRPVHHRLNDRVMAHGLAYYVEWRLRKLLAPLLRGDEERSAPRSSPVAPARRSESTLENAGRKRTRSGFPAQSYQSLPRELAAVSLGRICFVADKTNRRQLAFSPTPLQAEAYRLGRRQALEPHPVKNVPSSAHLELISVCVRATLEIQPVPAVRLGLGRFRSERAQGECFLHGSRGGGSIRPR